MAKLEKEEAAKKTLEKVEGNSLDKTEGEFTNAEVPKRSEIITEIPPIAAAAAPGERVIRFGKKKVVVVGILAAAFVGMLGVTAIGGKNYFFRDREIEMGIIYNNDKNLRYNGSLDEIYYQIENELEISPLKLGYIPEGMELVELDITNKNADIVFKYKEKYIHFFQERLQQEASVGINSDRILLKDVIYNDWIKKDFVLEEENLEDGNIGYAAVLSLGNARYRIMGQFDRDMLVKIIENLNY